MNRPGPSRQPSRPTGGRCRLLVAAVLLGLLSGCAGGGLATPTPALTRLVVGLGYIPSVQFAQFYLAQQAGYYREAGLEIEFQNKIDPELVTLVGQGSLDLGMADGTSVIPAASQGIPVRYVATIYARFPGVVFAKASSGIRTAADLKGRRLGTPGKFGTNWIMLQGLLRSAGLTPNDLEIVLYPDFGQLGALRQGAVDAATGFANNEPVQLELAGEKATVLHVDAATPLPGPGLITGSQTLNGKREALRGFVAATLRGMREIQADPQKGLDAAIARVPELGSDRPTQLRILKATVETWQSPSEGRALGAIDREGWSKSIEFMASLPDRPVARPLTVDQVVTEELLPR